MEVLKSNLVATKVVWLHPYRVPAAPARAAEVTKAIILYLVTLMPTLSAAMQLSRAAMMARPVRLLTRLKMTTRVITTSTKPTVKVEMRWVFITPMGPADQLKAALLQGVLIGEEAEVQPFLSTAR